MSLPIDAATQTFAFIARKRAGKTYAAGKLTELLIDAGLQVVALDMDEIRPALGKLTQPKPMTSFAAPIIKRTATTMTPRLSAPKQSSRSTAGSENGSLAGAQRRILNAVAWWNSIGVDAPTRAQVGFVARIKPTGGHFSNSIGPLSTSGYLENVGDARVRLTEIGIATAEIPTAAPTLDEYQQAIRSVLKTGAQQRIFDAIVSAGGEPITVEQIGEDTGNLFGKVPAAARSARTSPGWRGGD